MKWHLNGRLKDTKRQWKSTDFTMSNIRLTKSRNINFRTRIYGQTREEITGASLKIDISELPLRQIVRPIQMTSVVQSVSGTKTLQSGVMSGTNEQRETSCRENGWMPEWHVVE